MPVTVERVELRRPDTQLPAFAALPQNVRSDTPGIVVVMDRFGVDAMIREVLTLYAKAGFAAIAPDLYGRQTEVNPELLQPAQVTGDLRAAALWLKSRHAGGRIGIAGFGVGGRYALLEAIDNDDVLSAVALWYADPTGIDPAGFLLPLVAAYGERDTAIPLDAVRNFRKRLRGPNDIAIYPGAGHGFFDQQRPNFAQEAALDSWRRSVLLFTKFLKP